MTNIESNERTSINSAMLNFDGKGHSAIAGRKTAFYKILLFLLDIFIVQTVFLTGCWLSGLAAFDTTGLREIAISAITGLVAISFLPVFNTYSYHLIFSKSNHLSMLLKAMGWGGVSMGILHTIFAWPKLFEGVFIAPAMIIFAVVILILSRFYSDQLINLLMALGISFLATAGIELLKTNEVPIILDDAWATPLSFIASVILIVVGRLFTVQFIFNKILRTRFRRQIAIIGSDDDARNIIDHIILNNAPFWVAGFIGDNSLSTDNASVIDKPYLGTVKELPEIVIENRLNEIIVTDELIDKLTLINILDYCTQHRVAVWFPPKLMPIIEMKLYIDNFCDLPMIRLGTQPLFNVFKKIKYSFDALLTLIIFLAQLPIFAAICMAIKLDSRGPVFYKARAIGKYGKEFFMFKFRSMYTDNKSDIHKDYVTKLIKGEIGTDKDKGETLKITDDPRVTRVGNFIRKYSLDELPQLINVLRGEMSLIGPRPCLPYEYEIYLNWYKKRTAVRPGISGLWQVTGRSEVAFEDMILLDLYYIYNPSFSMDFNILFETVFVVFGKKGAY